MYVKREISGAVRDSLNSFPIVLLTGARQVGKSTFTNSQLSEYKYFTLDNSNTVQRIESDPLGFVKGADFPVVIDEVQKMPALMNSIKTVIDECIYKLNIENSIDESNVKGKFLLTGSANISMMKKITETLAGRLVLHELMPFSQKEIRLKTPFSMDELHNNPQNIAIDKSIDKKDIENAVIIGGYPERVKLSKNIFNMRKWTDSYIETYIERDIRDINEIKNMNAFVRLYNLLAHQSAAIAVKQNLAVDVKLSIPTVTTYIEILSQIYQIYWLPCWFPDNSSKQFIKSPKLYFTDSGILSHCLDIDSIQDLEKSRKRGNVVETFVLSELRKAMNNGAIARKEIYYMRTKDGKEADFIIEGNGRQNPLAIEVKASQTLHSDDFEHIRFLQKECPELNFQGVVFYLGDEIVPFGKNLTAVPISAFF